MEYFLIDESREAVNILRERRQVVEGRVVVLGSLEQVKEVYEPDIVLVDPFETVIDRRVGQLNEVELGNAVYESLLFFLLAVELELQLNLHICTVMMRFSVSSSSRVSTKALSMMLIILSPVFTLRMITSGTM